MNEDTYWLYTQMLIDGEAQGKSHDEIAEILKIHRNTVHNWNKTKIDWNYINAERRKRYGEKIASVDDAMFNKASKGDVNAAKLVYERFDGYTPTVASLNITDKKDDELTERAKSILNKLSGEKGTGSDKPGTGEAAA